MQRDRRSRCRQARFGRKLPENNQEKQFEVKIISWHQQAIASDVSHGQMRVPKYALHLLLIGGAEWDAPRSYPFWMITLANVCTVLREIRFSKDVG